jgi:hypothetical protein
MREQVGRNMKKRHKGVQLQACCFDQVVGSFTDREVADTGDQRARTVIETLPTEDWRAPTMRTVSFTCAVNTR